MPARNQKIAKYKKRKPIRINIGIIIFLFIFIYLVSQILFYLNKDHISIYEVVSTSMYDNNTITGLILREEIVCLAEQSGYVNFYLNDAGRTAKHDIVYTIDETGDISEKLSETTSMANQNVSDKSIQTLLTRYSRTDTGDFQSVYHLKESIMDEFLQSSGVSMLSSLHDILQTYGDNGNFHVNRSEESGIITFYTDGYETMDRNSIQQSDFTSIDTSYRKNVIANSSLVEQGQPVYKIIPSETWSIIVPIDITQYEKLLSKDYVDIIIRKDNLKTTAAVTVFSKQEEYYAELTLRRYMVRYVNQRFLEISLSLNSASGLKIPKSAIVDKNFFKVPLEYLSAGGDGSGDGVIRETISENGEIQYTYYATDIYYKDEEFAYIATDAELKAGDRLRKTDSSDTYILAETASLKGVYNANKGYAVFRRIEPLYENEEYCIVADNTSYGLSEYDHIVLQGELAVNQALIY